MNDSHRIQASAEVVSRVVDGEAVLLDLESGKYFGLDEVGSTVWEHIQQPTTVAALMTVLLEEFDVDRETLRKDLEELLTELVAKGLVSVEPSLA